MAGRKPNLANKPLVEAILEIRWELQSKETGATIDPHYKILLGRFYDRIIKEYPRHEELASAGVPEGFLGHVPQHRFRKASDGWPLVQIGPGLVTLNDTESYRWTDFQKRAHRLLSNLFTVYPRKRELRVSMASLRYIDFVGADLNQTDALKYLGDMMKTNIEIEPTLFSGTGVNSLAHGVNLNLSYRTTRPKGTIGLKFARGQLNQEDGLVLETSVQSLGKDAPKTEKGLKNWLEKAHDLTDDWFFKIIEGELYERFK